MYKIGDKIIILGEGNETEYELIDIDEEGEEYPYECYPMSVVKRAKEIAETCEDYKDDYRGVILCSVYSGEFVDKRVVLSEVDMNDCKYATEISNKNKEVEFYKDMAMSLIVAIDQNVCEFDEKMRVFRESCISPEEFRKLGYDSLACQLEDTEE
mgnify:CR=1 FL=1